MSGRSSQAKGRRGEDELANILRGYGYDVQRGGSLTFGEVPDLRGLPGIHCEVKRHERLNVWEALEQAERDSKRFGGRPALFFRRNRSPWFVAMSLPDWMTMYAAFARKKSENTGKEDGG